MALELDPVLRYGEFAVRTRTGEGILGDGVHPASQLPVYTGITPGPTGNNKLYAMCNGNWVSIKRKVKPTPDEPSNDPTDPTGE